MGKGTSQKKTEILLLQTILTANPICFNWSVDDNIKGLFKGTVLRLFSALKSNCEPMTLLDVSCWSFKVVMQGLSRQAHMPLRHALEALAAWVAESLGCLCPWGMVWGNHIGPEGCHELLKLQVITATNFHTLVYTNHSTSFISFNYDNNPVRYYSSHMRKHCWGGWKKRFHEK